MEKFGKWIFARLSFTAMFQVKVKKSFTRAIKNLYVSMLSKKPMDSAGRNRDVGREATDDAPIGDIPDGGPDGRMLSSNLMYEPQSVRQHGHRIRFRGMRRYDSEDIRHLPLGNDGCAMGELGPGIWTTTVYLCWEGGNSTGGSRKSLSLEHWYLSRAGNYMRHRWISPDEIFGALIWQNGKNKIGTMDDVTDLGREEGGSMRKLQMLIVREDLIQKKTFGRYGRQSRISVELARMAGHAGIWLLKEIHFEKDVLNSRFSRWGNQY